MQRKFWTAAEGGPGKTGAGAGGGQGQVAASHGQDDNSAGTYIYMSKPLEIRFVLLLLLLLPFVTNLQNRTGSDLFSPDKIRHVQFRHVGM